MQQRKMGIIGFGGMANWHFRSLKQHLPQLQVTGVYDIDPERLADAEKKGLKAYPTLEAFLDSRDFDLVLVATPNNFHCEQVCKALEAGYHVICEKPVALTSEELQRMIDTAERCGKVFTVHQNRRWDQDFLTVKAALEQNAVGKPYTIESCVHGSGGVVHGWRAYQVAGGGMLYDWGVHLIDQILQLYPNSKVTNVFCQMHSVKTPEVDDYFKLLFSLEDGPDVQIEVGTYCLKQKPRWYVNGDGGSLVVQNWDLEGSIIHSAVDEMKWEPEVVQTKAGPTRTMAPRPKETLTELPLPEVGGTDWLAFYRNVLRVLDGQEELLVKPAEAMRVLKVMEAAFTSAREKRAVAAAI